MKAWYKVRSPSGYECLELAVGPGDARRRAASRPGYEEIDRLQVELYKPYAPPVNYDKMRASIALAREKGLYDGCRKTERKGK